ncbi:hypothetical protein GWK47_024974 [Chionoecetes opilio]|uniref:Uncharacterized protein n=1 Tax=Chionoecetes opilio TaxID=41210 RepID=A0A8J4XL68_CHIOP|nr:hypothetical protein GWK47_024974 [Chionoecetes opilio]
MIVSPSVKLTLTDQTYEGGLPAKTLTTVVPVSIGTTIGRSVSLYQRPQPRDADAMQLFRLSSLVVVAALLCTGNTVVWGCLPTRMDDSCISETTVGIHLSVCYCNSDYCNTSAPTSLPSLLLLIPLLVSFLPTHVF